MTKRDIIEQVHENVETGISDQIINNVYNCVWKPRDDRVNVQRWNDNMGLVWNLIHDKVHDPCYNVVNTQVGTQLRNKISDDPI